MTHISCLAGRSLVCCTIKRFWPWFAIILTPLAIYIYWEWLHYSDCHKSADTYDNHDRQSVGVIRGVVAAGVLVLVMVLMKKQRHKKVVITAPGTAILVETLSGDNPVYSGEVGTLQRRTLRTPTQAPSSITTSRISCTAPQLIWSMASHSHKYGQTSWSHHGTLSILLLCQYP